MPRLPAVLLLGLTLAVGFAPTGAAQATEDSSPTAALDAIFAEWDRDDGPGVAVAAVFDGTIIYERGFGLANVEQGTPITPDTIFRIGSTSKQFTAICIAMLALRGELDLDADIRTWLPELSDELPVVPLRDLVHHTSGLPDYIGLHMTDGLGEGNHLTPEHTLERLSRVTELEFPVGTNWSYSNTNYFLMGEIVRRVSGQTLREFADEHIFAPVGMTHTHFHDRAAELVPGRADGYARAPAQAGRPDQTDGSGPTEGPAAWSKANTTWDHVGDGGVFTTVRDLALWTTNFDDNKLQGGDQLLELILTPGTLADGSPHGYAFGLRVDAVGGRQAIHHGGGWVGFTAGMVRFPDERLSVVVFSNCQAPSDRLAMRLANLLLGDP